MHTKTYVSALSRPSVRAPTLWAARFARSPLGRFVGSSRCPEGAMFKLL